jgi:hypothetical protein
VQHRSRYRRERPLIQWQMHGMCQTIGSQVAVGWLAMTWRHDNGGVGKRKLQVRAARFAGVRIRELGNGRVGPNGSGRWIGLATDGEKPNAEQRANQQLVRG